ncbi:cytochrome c oxidase assembly factor Coa1 family protein [Xanthomonas sp. D-109]|uniref:cytochrome c oxidase assembly factor Coa1 family protein n=1 Tax=Xanthomonas sp. D-109 TaxID=2821274 RepID=UPI001ADCD727|nr:cytochrome c oxidase assembly factor Coa1 family protein [Xanthomonas sp. D-109]MBO9880760.1 cytochrome c oxidase assembly factor 1 family protein [Xanthomonas sp. D-109]
MSSPPPLPGTPDPTSATAQPPAKRGWWARHWKWAVPLIVLVLGALLLASIAVFVLGIARVTKSSEPYRVGVMAAQRDPRVAAALGAPIKDGIMPSGSFNSSGAGSGNAALSVSLHGTRANGTLYIEAERHAGEWHYTTLQVLPDAGEAIPLLDALGQDADSEDDEAADGMAVEAPPVPAADVHSATPAEADATQ